MMHVGSGIRDEWKFEYTAMKLATGAMAQKDFRISRVEWWTEQKSKLMAEIKESGLEVNESLGALANLSYANTTSANGPTISIRPDLQKKLSECHSKIQAHTQMVAEYDGWVQVLTANPENRLELTQSDWLFFFGKV